MSDGHKFSQTLFVWESLYLSTSEGQFYLLKYSWLAGFLKQFNVSSHTLLVCKISPEKSVDSLIGIPLYVMTLFSPTVSMKISLDWVREGHILSQICKNLISFILFFSSKSSIWFFFINIIPMSLLDSCFIHAFFAWVHWVFSSHVCHLASSFMWMFVM